MTTTGGSRCPTLCPTWRLCRRQVGISSKQSPALLRIWQEKASFRPLPRARAISRRCRACSRSASPPILPMLENNCGGKPWAGPAASASFRKTTTGPRKVTNRCQSSTVQALQLQRFLVAGSIARRDWAHAQTYPVGQRLCGCFASRSLQPRRVHHNPAGQARRTSRAPSSIGLTN